MHRLACISLSVALACTAPSASAELSDEDMQAIACAAHAIVVNGTVRSIVETEQGLSERFQAMTELAAEDLFFDAAGLIDPGSEGAEEIAQLFESLLDERDTARATGTFAEWFPEVVGVVQECHLAFLNRQEQAE